MENVITVGKRLVAVDQIVLVEPFDPTARPDFKPDREFKGRIIMLNRDTVLTETMPVDFVTEHGFRLLDNDGTAINPRIYFRVEIFEPNASFTPTKPYATRLKWADATGSEQSRLLVTRPDEV